MSDEDSHWRFSWRHTISQRDLQDNLESLLQHTATHCNTVQHTATYCNTLSHKEISRTISKAYCNTLQHTATHCNTLPHTATHCNTLQHIVGDEDEGMKIWMRLMVTGWRGPIECLKLQVIFRKRATNYRALLRNMTYKDKASYHSTPPHIFTTWCNVG